MSVDAISWAFRQKGVRSGAKFVLVALADRVGPGGYCWPSHRDIGERCGMTKRSVVAHLAELEAMGLIRREHRRRRDGSRASDRIFLILPADLGAWGQSENFAPEEFSPLESSPD